MPPLTLRQRLELRAAKILPLLSPRMQLRLSGKPPVTRDGLTLEPEIQLLLSLIERRARPPYEELSLKQARAEMTAGAVVGGGSPPFLPEVRNLSIDGAEGPLPARHYIAARGEPSQPLIVFFHGGGFVLGDLDSHDVPCRLLAKHSGAQVLSVDYRLAPEHPFPAAVQDACAALDWAFANAEALGADPQRVAVAGDSAGGNLAAVTAWRAARSENAAGRLALQILIYPATEFVGRSPSQHMFDEGFLLIRRDMDWFSAQYAGGADHDDSSLSIARAPDLSRTPPAIVVTAGFDPLRDEGEAYGVRLREEGVPVIIRRFPGLIHGFINLVGVSRSSRDAVIEIAGATRAMLTASAPADPTASSPAEQTLSPPLLR